MLTCMVQSGTWTPLSFQAETQRHRESQVIRPIRAGAGNVDFRQSMTSSERAPGMTGVTDTCTAHMAAVRYLSKSMHHAYGRVTPVEPSCAMLEIYSPLGMTVSSMVSAGHRYIPLGARVLLGLHPQLPDVTVLKKRPSCARLVAPLPLEFSPSSSVGTSRFRRRTCPRRRNYAGRDCASIYENSATNPWKRRHAPIWYNFLSSPSTFRWQLRSLLRFVGKLYNWNNP
ncbi:hypothetical protein C8T65DRAFT_700212 [Cerioporus squamosus]|nr:hypothetical protein C8T65DRAFT_700212 [Cerioporus squamosus]